MSFVGMTILMGFPKDHAKQKGFVEDVTLLVIKGFFH
jgi:hypothetical protein